MCAGPGHFTANTNEELGVTKARRACLYARKWAVASVHHAVWAQLRGNAVQQQQHLLHLMKMALESLKDENVRDKS